ncbi:hypothetical protein D5S17_32020 [Pseudonocardiaceae bacterium YIM PH 21723]|nr:hypothetical protein D5S17_32020 [Pseudonocardiaceae bacterium YIM PH 21723]
MTRVLVIGFDPATIPGYDPAPVLAALDRGRARFTELGIDYEECLVPLDDRVEQRITEALTAAGYECVVVGGGLRKPEELLELFERVVNLVRVHQPGAAIAFNSNPEDSADAALRWLPQPS